MPRWITNLLSRFMGTCREATAEATNLTEGALPEAERARLQRHLLICPGCKAHRAQMETGVRALRALPAEPIEDAEKDALLRRFRTRTRG
jgi:anti-sigma factor RsiW